MTEGRVETVTLDGHQEKALKMAFPQAEGQVLNLRDIEQGLEQLNRMSSRALTVDILPGSREGFSGCIGAGQSAFSRQSGCERR